MYLLFLASCFVFPNGLLGKINGLHRDAGGLVMLRLLQHLDTQEGQQVSLI